MLRLRDIALLVEPHPLRRVPARARLLVLCVLATALVWSALASASVGSGAPSGIASSELTDGAETGDLRLYRRIGQRVSAGESYYTAALTEHRLGGYPTTPAVTVRLPSLAWLYAAVGERGFAIVLTILVVANATLLPRAFGEGPERIGVGILVLLGSAVLANPDMRLLHELWAGLLVTLALAAYRPSRWWPSLLLGSAALAVRELALPFLLLWAAFSLVGRRWRELAAIGLVLVIFGVCLTQHWAAVADATQPGDLSSPGWRGLIGPSLFIDGIRRTTLLLVLPAWTAGPTLVLALFGLGARGGRIPAFAFLWIVGLIVLISVFARADNWYWATLALPMIAAGLALAPGALSDSTAGS